jgi:uncharacterized protein (TIGR04255 family)
MIKPVSGKHAVEVMAIGVEWTNPLGDAELQQLQEVYTATPEIKDFLPSLASVRSLMLQIGIADTLQSNITPEDHAGGFDLKRFDTSGAVLWAVSVRPAFISCNCMAYDRWATVKPQVINLLYPFLTAAGREIKAVGLQYQDAFNIEGELDQTVITSLFRQDSALLPTHLLATSSLWHSYQGWFSASPENRKILNNVNVDMQEQTPNHLARINGQHRVFSVSSDGKVSRPIKQEDLENALDHLHKENKDVLRKILSDEMLDRIGFEAKEKK